LARLADVEDTVPVKLLYFGSAKQSEINGEKNVRLAKLLEKN